MDKQKRKQRKMYLCWILLVAVVALLACLPMIADTEDPEAVQASILSAEAEKRDISVQVMGGGTLESQAAVEITIPSAVKLTEYLVNNGDLVAKGQAIAAVDRVSVMTAITQVQETMEYLQEQINSIRQETAPDQVTATAGGTVKILYAKEGESVQDVMIRDGALAVLSLDGLMAVEIQRSTDLSGGDQVCVTLSDGTETEGRVESNLDGVLTITVEDGDYPVGESVTVETEDGKRLGSGSLYIHSQWNVVAYSGSISKVRVSQGDQVTAGAVLFDLKDTGHTAQFTTLTRQHREYEALMLELFQMYQSERITAPVDGLVTGVDESGVYMLSDAGGEWTVSLLANSPNGDDERTYFNFIGQVAEVGIDGLILRMNPQPQSVTDYRDLSAVNPDPALMTEEIVYKVEAPVYELAGEEWIQIDGASILPGDVLLFAWDETGNLVWVVRVAGSMPEEPKPTNPEEPSEPTEPENPELPSDPAVPTEPEAPTDGAEPTAPEQAENERPQAGLPGMGGGMVQEETFELYGLDTVTVASITAQETVTIQISVDELDISQIYTGQAATVTVDALPGRSFEAVVTSIAGAGESKGGNSKFTVVLTMTREADMLPGMNASVAIPTDAVQDVIAVPAAALMEIETGTVVYTSYDEKTQSYGNPVSVTVGLSDGENAEITSGIGAGQSVYYPYYDTLVISNVPDMGGGFPFG